MTRHSELAPQWRERLAAAGLADLGILLDSGPAAPAIPGTWQALSKPGLGGRERWRWELDGGEAVLFVKRYRAIGLRAQFDRIRRQAARHSVACWEYRQARQLAEAHIPVARAVGFAEEMRGALEQRSAVLLERVAGDAFDRTWRRAAANSAPIVRSAARHDLTVRLARFVSAFHQTGCCHRDLYLCHIFVDLDESAQRPPTFCLIDLARTHRPRLLRMRWLLKDLAQLDASAQQIGANRTDRLRFLLAYLGLQPRAARTRWYARRVVRWSTRILQREARKVRSRGKRRAAPAGG